MTLFDIPFFKHEAGSVVKVLVYANFWSGDDIQLTAQVVVNGAVANTCSINLILDTKTSSARAPLTIPAFITGLSAGQHSIQFNVLNHEPDSALTVKAGATIEITELKRAAL